MFSGDIHLFDREIGVTIGYPIESERNLKKLNREFKESDCVLQILGGDIQHAKPEDIRQMSKWRSLLIDLRDEVYERLVKTGLIDKMKVYDKDGNEMDIKSEHSCLFSVKGNHDYNRRESKDTSFTFFDDLVESKVISVPRTIVIEKTQINLYSTGECMNPVPRMKGIETVIGVYHDPILQGGRVFNKYLGKTISPEEHKFFEEVDIAVVNDIHLPIDPYKVITIGKNGVANETTVITHGSIGRTAYNDSHQRDFAILTEITIEDNGDLSYELRKMDLFPYKELFDYEKAIKVKKRENMFEQFSLEIEKLDKVKADPREDIEKMDLDEEVKQICLDLLNEVMEGV